MPALIGAVAFPLLCLAGWVMTKLPHPTAADIASRSERVTLNARERMQLFRRFMPVLLMLFIANLLLTVQRDIKEDFIVCIMTFTAFRRGPSPISTALPRSSCWECSP